MVVLVLLSAPSIYARIPKTPKLINNVWSEKGVGCPNKVEIGKIRPKKGSVGTPVSLVNICHNCYRCTKKGQKWG